MFIALGRDHGRNALTVEDVELIGNLQLLENDDMFRLLFHDEEEGETVFEIHFMDSMVTVRQDQTILFEGTTHSMQFLEDVRNILVAYALSGDRFPSWETFNDQEYEHNYAVPIPNSISERNVAKEGAGYKRKQHKQRKTRRKTYRKRYTLRKSRGKWAFAK